MSEKRKSPATDLTTVENELEPSPSRKRKARRKPDYSTTIKALYGAAIVLAIAACAVIGVKMFDDLSAERSASTLLSAYKEMETAAPTAAVAPVAETSATIAEPETVNLPDNDVAAEEHRVDAENDIQVDESADYEQPDDPSVKETQEIIDQILASVGSDGVIGTIKISKTGQEYPIIGKWSYKLLKISICRYKGGAPNQAGQNLVLIGHNYKSGAHFGNLKSLEVGDEILLTATGGEPVRYEIYEMEGVKPDAFSALEKWRGEAGLTLMTCKNNGNNRLIVRCEQKDAPTSVAANAGTLS